MIASGAGVLLVDWENLAGALIARGLVLDSSKVLLRLHDFARTQVSLPSHGSGELNFAHVAAAKFDARMTQAMRARLIESEPVRSTKEQADIQLTVLAMDYLHQGCDNFVLVTGDQDFIPLITRLRRDGKKVTLVYGDPNRLSGELRDVLHIPGVASEDAQDIVQAPRRTPQAGFDKVLALLELQRRGMVLGGREKGDRIQLLSEWGILSSEIDYWALIEAQCHKVVRLDTAVLENGQWLPRNSTRLVIDMSVSTLHKIHGADFLVRFLSARPEGADLTRLRVGPFHSDDGTLLDEVLNALQSVGVVRAGADGKFAMTSQDLELGYLEPLWRLHAGLESECYRRGTSTMAYNALAGMLNRTGVGQGKERRAAGRVKDAIAYGRAASVFDTKAVGGKRHVQSTHLPISQPFDFAYRDFYRMYRDRVREPLEQSVVLRQLEEYDAEKTVPTFGWDNRDRHRYLRVMSQADLIKVGGERITLAESSWGDALSKVGAGR